MDIVLTEPLSASVERVFSIFEGELDSRQEKALEDGMGPAVIIKYDRYWEF